LNYFDNWTSNMFTDGRNTSIKTQQCNSYGSRNVEVHCRENATVFCTIS